MWRMVHKILLSLISLNNTCNKWHDSYWYTDNVYSFCHLLFCTMLSLFPMFSVRRRALVYLRELSENSWTKISQFLWSQIEDTSYLVSRHLSWLGKFRLSNIFCKKNNTFALFPFSVLSLFVLLLHLYIFKKSHVLYTAVNAFSLSDVNVTSFLICGLPNILYNFWAELSRFLFRVTTILVTFLLYF